MKPSMRSVFLTLAVLFSLSCERDDICIDEITPKLIIRFYDFENPELFKDVANLKVNIEGADGDYINEIKTFQLQISIRKVIAQGHAAKDDLRSFFVALVVIGQIMICRPILDLLEQIFFFYAKCQAQPVGKVPLIGWSRSGNLVLNFIHGPQFAADL